ncbi:MAG: hypothetical protein H6970_11110 [Gammaproteobacteria bacterium]|nr:hypothetical protein [Gammaproteobacteria bacterium]MCP5425599.1 hypothetical protein [Gammaproteobacteria bacterium]MCP5459001.1 hypothetical protein [Gammaproteobacteria bacterium]
MLILSRSGPAQLGGKYPGQGFATLARCLRLCLLAVWLPAQAVSADSARMPAPPVPLDQQVLADFDSSDWLRAHAEEWERYPRQLGNTVRFSLDTRERRGTQGSSLHLDYSFASEKSAEIGVRLQLPDLDASNFDHLAFWIKGDARTQYAKTIKVVFRGLSGDQAGWEERGSQLIDGIGDTWKQILAPLNRMTGLRDWTDLNAFLIAFHERRAPAAHGAYYIDDVRLVKTGHPGPSIDDPVPTPRKKAWENAYGGREAAQPQRRARLVGWPRHLLVDGSTLPGDDAAFLRRLAQDTWNGLTALNDREHGLPLDTVRFDGKDTDFQRARIGDYTSVTNIGLYMVSVVAAWNLGFIDHVEALTALNTTLTTLERLETYQGFFYNYYDTTSLERTTNFVSFVDSSWLTTGLLIVRGAFPELYARCTRLVDQGDYGFFYDPVEQQMSHGYYVNLPGPSEFNYGVLISEARLGSLIAIGKGDVPEEHWFRMARILPPQYDWQSLPPDDYREQIVHGFRLWSGFYRWRDFAYVPSWGGSLFEVLMPELVLDENRYAPASLGRNAQMHVAVQREFALQDLGYPVWGLSPSSTPVGDDYHEYGVKVLGMRGYGPGAVTPHASALALLVAPEAAIANLRALVKRYPLYGEYGLYDAVDPYSGQVAYKYLALNQGMLFIALANYLGDHGIQRLFAADPMVSRVLPLLAAERFFE